MDSDSVSLPILRSTGPDQRARTGNQLVVLWHQLLGLKVCFALYRCCIRQRLCIVIADYLLQKIYFVDYFIDKLSVTHDVRAQSK
jgi:hypothetical protein